MPAQCTPPMHMLPPSRSSQQFATHTTPIPIPFPIPISTPSLSSHSPILPPLPPQITPFSFNTNTATTTPATSAIKHSQNTQHSHVRCRCLRFWPASHESLRGGSAEIVVQNLKREGGRPESARESVDALLGREGEKGFCVVLWRFCWW